MPSLPAVGSQHEGSSAFPKVLVAYCIIFGVCVYADYYYLCSTISEHFHSFFFPFSWPHLMTGNATLRIKHISPSRYRVTNKQDVHFRNVGECVLKVT